MTTWSSIAAMPQVLCFRNNDSVNRRLKLLPLDSPHFSISGPRSPHKLKALKQTKVRSSVHAKITRRHTHKKGGLKMVNALV